MPDEVQIEELEEALLEEHRLDLEALRRLKRFLPNKGENRMPDPQAQRPPFPPGPPFDPPDADPVPPTDKPFENPSPPPPPVSPPKPEGEEVPPPEGGVQP